jgi:penicillin-binding protein 2
VGVEAGFDQELRGKAGAKSVLVNHLGYNHLGYRQSQNIWTAVEPGQNVVLTIDYSIQQAAEQALRRPFGTETRGAAVVMDVWSGDILALASSPTYNPNLYIRGISRTENDYLIDPKQTPEKNRATQTPYQAGSTFKVIVALAALENGLNPDEKYYVEPNPKNPARGIIYVGNQPFHDTAPPGDYDLRRALVRSSNVYFITNGLKRGVFDRVVELGRRLHLGEKIDLPLRQEATGHFPSAERVHKWPAGNSANICIGQGEMDMTPMQMAVLTAALANGGEVLQPRLVDRLESQDPASVEPITVLPKHQVRDTLGVSQRSLNIVRDDMLAETEDAVEGTGRSARVAGLRICGKTGTAERKEHGQTRNTTWFISFAPYEHPKYAVVVAVEDGGSGGATCAPIAQLIYLAIQAREKSVSPKTTTLTQAK